MSAFDPQAVGARLATIVREAILARTAPLAARIDELEQRIVHMEGGLAKATRSRKSRKSK